MGTGKLFLIAALSLAGIAIAADEPTTKPAETSKKLFEPYALLKDLTPDQTAQIEKIHKDFLEERRKLEVKQHDDIDAVLTADQKTELTKAEDKLKATRKAEAAQRKKAATEPSE